MSGSSTEVSVDPAFARIAAVSTSKAVVAMTGADPPPESALL
jgi:hypothetical protein